MSGARVSGLAVAEIGAGLVLAWSGLKNQTVGATLTSLLKGQDPADVPEAPVSAGITDTASTAPSAGSSASAPPAPVSTSALVAAIKLMAATYGWAGAEWDALYDLWQRESGFDPLACNPSGAFGVAQALGHGTAASAATVPTVHVVGQPDRHNVRVDAYPGYIANTGDGTAQAAWGLGDIKSVYGSPSAAWAHEQSAGWY